MSLLTMIGFQLRVLSSRVTGCSPGFSTLNVRFVDSCGGMGSQYPEWTLTSRVGGVVVAFRRRPIIDRLVVNDIRMVIVSSSEIFGLFKGGKILERLRLFMRWVDIIPSRTPVNPLKNRENSLARERR